MPFVYSDETEWPDDYEPPAPRPDQFIYLPPPDFGGAREPVRFSIVPLDGPMGLRRRGLLDRLFGEPAPAYKAPRSRKQGEENAQRLFALMVPALRDLGVRRLYCRYDGGNDEGFAWLDGCETNDGQRMNADALVRKLSATRIMGRLCAVGVAGGGLGLTDRKQLRAIIRDWLVREWAIILLGHGYGTGEYSMFGAFTVDLEACTISDDPGAEAVARHIRIAR